MYIKLTFHYNHIFYISDSQIPTWRQLAPPFLIKNAISAMFSTSKVVPYNFRLKAKSLQAH